MYHLLKETDENKAFEIASKLDDLNKKRRFLTTELESKIIGQIEKIITENNSEVPSALVVYGR